jgi:hypothetical protein
MYRRILQDPLRFPDEIGGEARSILSGLLTRDASQRLGVRGAESIKSHPFFSRHIDWLLLMQKKIKPPFKPSVVRLLPDYLLMVRFVHAYFLDRFMCRRIDNAGKRYRHQQFRPSLYIRDSSR